MSLLRSSLLLLAVCNPTAAAAQQDKAQPANSPREQYRRPEWLLSGVVRDEEGRAVEGAVVFALFCDGSPSLSPGEGIRSTRTDAQGRWAFKGGGGPLFPVSDLPDAAYGSLIAFKPGRLPAVLPLPTPDFAINQKDKPAKSRIHELILPSRGGRLEVQVFRDGKSLPGAAVQLHKVLGPWLYPHTSRNASGGPERDNLERILYPAATSDAQGIARFRDLLPGIYIIYAVDGTAEEVRELREEYTHRVRRPHAIGCGIAVRPGETTRFQLSVYPQPHRLRVQVIHTDGKPAANRHSWGEAENIGDNWYRHSLSIDKDGTAEHAFERPGLWRVLYRYRDSPISDRQADREAPYYEASSVVAVSPLLAESPPVVLTARRRESGTFSPPAAIPVEKPPRVEVQRGRNGLILFGRPEEDIRIHVRLADGKTPVGEAQLFIFQVRSPNPVASGCSDAHGRIHLQTGIHWTSEPGPPPPGDPIGPVALVRMPGVYGAAIVPLKLPDEVEMQAVLPLAIRLRGKVTVGGRSIRKWNNQFRVLAAYEGKGKLNRWLSLDVTPSADGGFELSGLTPGVYRIQAAMDDIWLSQSIHLIVKPGMETDKLLSLDIGRPGWSSTLELVHADGKPAVGVDVTIVRPPGPLTERLWPTHFTSDGAGTIALPPLEVGTHKLSIKGITEGQTLTVPALTEPLAKPVKKRIALR